jgi:hypothetical protein
LLAVAGWSYTQGTSRPMKWIGRLATLSNEPISISKR